MGKAVLAYWPGRMPARRGRSSSGILAVALASLVWVTAGLFVYGFVRDGRILNAWCLASFAAAVPLTAAAGTFSIAGLTGEERQRDLALLANSLLVIAWAAVTMLTNAFLDLSH